MNAALARNYGYVVASISLIGPSDEQTFQSRTAHDLQAAVRDMEFEHGSLRGVSMREQMSFSLFIWNCGRASLVPET